MRYDPNGYFWWIIPIVIVTAISLSGCSRSSGSWKYTPSSSKNFNCYAYALGLQKWTFVGLGKVEVTGWSVEQITDQVVKDLKSMGRSARIMKNRNDPINSNEYRIAVRVTTPKSMEKYHIYDYHFMVQHSDGSWSHKPGEKPTILLEKGQHPGTYGVWSAMYDSNIKYLAITRR